ncbi:AAA family ATPase [Planococcus sp. CP5-4]|uniref:ATP-binding protein n=1 Tax=unclassified Planococcus (in: firmicutes) TaxID=2662419 RepID=UPI001C24C109|nr:MULTISPECIES: AAA family ATPase [unclassified Planococcus (in: firmicutes)]MBU9675203.1 AAA family ATPase [Planococcus sp. CP5-4_YE]MBV0910715.1 AAA family ATPase [Planococcus sp. CP5-4_UN]MBW6065484.1 AAA family ATPase [Planococcus sp. CP5-4]
MKLKKVVIENFRSYKDRIEVNFDDLTTFIGKNDIGKSTVLEALEIFFNNSKVKIEPKDACVHSVEDKVTIGCIFENVKDMEIVIDSTAPTTAEQEYIINSDGHLEVYKTFDCSKKIPTVEIFINAMYPTIESASDLHELKITRLKERVNYLGIDTSDIDMRSNVELRQAIFNSIDDLELALKMIPVKAEGVKPIWDKLSLHLPIFTLFQSDRTSSDSDSEVQDPMKLAVQAAIQNVETQLEEIKKMVMEEALTVAGNTLSKLREMDESLANQLSPRFNDEPKWSSIFKLSLEGDDGIPINKRGSGVRRLILLNFFRAEAEKSTLGSSERSIIYAIEEPETSQHPSNQILLAKTLRSLSENENTQVILTTHVPGLAGVLPTDSLRFVVSTSEGKMIKTGNDDETISEIAETLGVLPSVTDEVKVIVIVEGVHDVSTLNVFSKLMSENVDDIINIIEDDRVVIMPAGGSTLKKWVELNYLKKFNLPEVHIYDGDALTPPKYHATCQEVNNRDDNSVAYSTKKRELENYLHADAINSVCEVNVSFTSTCSVPEITAKSLYERDTGLEWDELDAENQRGKKSNAKKRLNNEVVNFMTYEQLREADDEGEVREWLREISRLCI